MVVGVGSESHTRRRSRNQVQKPELEEFGGDLASIIGALVAPLWVTRLLSGP
jgi:hypothetical protein